ncbi:MAG: hypothetical protein VR69_03100, partial [Peptococcaceae bacterium BRH_c4b]
MDERRPLPIQLVLPRESDVRKVEGGGSKKYFCDFTPELRQGIADQFSQLLKHFDANFSEYPNVPCVGKVIMKDKAIAKSHRPTRLLNSDNCPIIGMGKLNEVFIKVTPRGINHTLQEVLNSNTQDLEINMTKIERIEPYSKTDVLHESYRENVVENMQPKKKNAIKIKLFDFMSDKDNLNNLKAFMVLVEKLGLKEHIKEVNYSPKMRVFKLNCNDEEKLNKIIRFSGVKKISFFPQYSSIDSNEENVDLKFDKLGSLPLPEPDSEYPTIGVVDSGIKPGHKYLEPWIYKREVFVPDKYQNNYHGTFVAGVLQFGHIINGFNSRDSMFKILDVVALPNSDDSFGPVDGVDEDDLLEILRDVLKRYSHEIKVWNLSLGTNCVCEEDSMSDFAIAIDTLQDEFDVQIFIAAGNYCNPPLRSWPPQSNLVGEDRITSPADSVRSITVGSIAHKKGAGCVDAHNPSPFSRRGPGGNYIVKPDVVDYGGNCTSSLDPQGCGIVSFDMSGNLVEDVGTSFSTPRVAGIYGHVLNGLNAGKADIAKALLIHSCRNPLSSKAISKDEAQYIGFGLPNPNLREVLFCDKSAVTLIFDTEIQVGTYLSLDNFPYPNSLFKDGKWHGEIMMTLLYNPALDASFGQEYCRTNVDVSLGVYKYSAKKGEFEFKGQVPLDVKWEEKYERERVENGFNWCPIKSYYRKIKQGIGGASWRLYVDCTTRSNAFIERQPFTLIITIKDPSGKEDIYSEVINQLRERGFSFKDLQVQER